MTSTRRALGPVCLCLALTATLSGCDCSESPVSLLSDGSVPIGYDDAGNPIYPDASAPIGYDDAGNPIYPDAGDILYPDASTPIGYDDAGNPVYPDASLVCLDPGADCVQGAQPLCCSGLCVQTDAGTSKCKAPTLCSADGVACSAPTDCCSLSCSGGVCGRQACKQESEACADPSDCCSGLCTGGVCTALPTSCTTLGEACSAGWECCSQNCQGNTCLRASSCSAAGDICYAALDCCNGQCTNIPAGGGPGVCADGVNVPGATTCGIGGEPCSGSENCCSHLCLDLGSGQATCVLGSGCRERGEICVEDSECCGSSSSGVFCSKNLSTDLVGRCSNKQACQPVGNCCGLGANCEQACCDGKKAVCRIDAQGLSRCFGGGSVCPNGYDGLDPNCCIAAGDECVFRDQCCNLLPCVPVNGVYVCQAQQCIAAGEVCVPGGTGAEACCNELPCLDDGAGGYICRQGTRPDAGTPGLDAATLQYDDAGNPIYPDAGPACLPMGAACTDSAQCCSGTCTQGELGGTCTPPVAGYDDAGQPIFEPWDGGSGNPHPDASAPGPDAGPTCLPNNSTCTLSGQCCSGTCTMGEITGTCTTCKANGLSCTGNDQCCSTSCSNGVCNTPIVCVGTGGTCSGTSECCSGLACQIAAGQPTGTCQASGTCSSAGQSCSGSKPCCTSLRCENASTANLCAANDTACVCRIIIN